MKSLRNWIKTAVLAAAFFLSGLAHLPAEAKTLDRVVAKVNTEIITLSLIEDRVVFLREKGGAPSDMPLKALLEAALNQIIDEKLQTQEAKRLKMTVDEESVLKAVDDIKSKNGLSDDELNKMLDQEKITLDQYKGRIRDQILMSKVVSFQLRNRIIISEKEMKQYYLAHQKDFFVPDKIHSRHILFIFDSGITEAQKQAKRKRAEEALKRLRDGEDFSEMARKYSEDVSASSGGDLGSLERGKMVPAFEEAAFKLRPGEISSIVETRYGLHIIKLEEFDPGKTRPYSEVKGQIDHILFSGKREKEYKAWVDELRKAAFIETSLSEEFGNKGDSGSGDAKKPEAKENRGGVDTANLPQSEPAKKKTELPQANVKKQKPSGNAVAKKSRPAPPQKPVDSIPPKMETEDEDPRQALGFDVMEKKLIDIKELRKRNAISESEYQQRKKQLLNQL